MKYKVIGCTSFENNDIPDGTPTIATDNAIVDDIKTTGYCFTGCEHQNQPTGTPVLNDGKDTGENPDFITPFLYEETYTAEFCSSPQKQEWAKEIFKNKSIILFELKPIDK